MKPGYKTTEFWIATIATIVGLIVASGAVTEGSAVDKIVAFATAVLASFGYSVSRGMAKKG